MLELTRRINEAVELHDTRTGEALGSITLLGFVEGKARLGFEFPRHISIVRDNAVNKRRKEDEDTETEGQGGGA